MAHLHDTITGGHVHDDGSWVAGAVAPPAPSLVAGAAAGGTLATITISDASGGTAAHRVQVRQVGGAWADAVGAANPMPPGTTEFAATGLPAGQQVQAQVRAELAGLNSAYVPSAAWWQDVAVGGGGVLPGGGAGPGDTSAPVLTAGSVTGGTLTAAAAITSDEAGTLFWQVTQSSTPLSIPAAPGAMTGWTTRAMTAGVNSWSMGAQAAGSGYYLHLCAQDDEATPNRRGTDLVVGPFTVSAPAPTAPSFSLQPVSQAVVAGQVVTLAVAVAGTAPINVQWRRAGQPISGANALSYSFAAQLADSGVAFDAVATNVVDSVASSPAVLTVTPAPLAALPMYTLLAPQDQIDNLGGFGPKDPAARVLLAFEFKRWMPGVQDAEVSIIRARGAADDAPSALLDGERILQGTRVLQWVHGGTMNADYELRVVATGSDGAVAALEGILPVRDA